jgi:CheY-like chemotaxis protein
MNIYPQPHQPNARSEAIPFAMTISPETTMNRKRILIVDDSLIILKTLSMKLKNSGYDVLTATDGGTAVSTVRHERPDLILLDISFPPDVAHGGGVAWDGFLIMGWLRRLEEGKNIPIIIITGGDPEKLKDRALAAGAIAFFQKPINTDDLLTSIRDTIGEAPIVPPAAA